MFFQASGSKKLREPREGYRNHFNLTSSGFDLIVAAMFKFIKVKFVSRPKAIKGPYKAMYDP